MARLAHVARGATQAVVRVGAIIIVAIALASAAPAQGITEIIAITGNTAPDGNGTLDAFEASFGASLNDAGQVLFRATLAGTSGGMDDDFGIFRGELGSLVQIARENPANETVFDFGLTSLGTPVMNEAGQVAFRATTIFPASAGGMQRDGVFQGSGGLLTTIASQGNGAPDGNGLFESFAFIPALNGTGQSAFRASLTGTSGGATDDEGIYRGSGSTTTQIARAGQPAPDGNGSFFGLSSALLGLNGLGQVAFSAELTGTIGGMNDNIGIFSGDGSVITQIVRTGQTVPDGNGIFDTLFLGSDVNNSGLVQFRALLRSTSGGTSDDDAIFRSDGSTLVQIAREGQAAPDGNGTIDSFQLFGINESAQVVFWASLAGTNENTGIFRADGSTLTQIVRAGQSAPDGNGTFSGIANDPSMNDAGQVVFSTGLTGTSGGMTDDTGIFLSNGIDILQVVREGDALGDSTVVGFSRPVQGGFDELRALNNFGQIACRVDLANGDEAIVRFTIPDIHWTNPGSGTWTTDANWTQSTVPNSFHDTFIDPTGSVIVQGSSQDDFVKSLTVGSSGSGLATLELDNGGSLTALGDINIAANGRIVVGTSHLLAGENLINAGELLGGGTIGAALNNLPSGQVRVAADQSMTIAGAGHVSAGLIEVIGGELDVVGDLANAAGTGLIAGRDAVMRFTGGLTNNGALALSFGTSDIHGDITNNGNVVVTGSSDATFYDDVTNNASLRVAAGSEAVFLGALAGNGATGSGTVFLEGDVQPGSSPGTMSFGGDVNFGFLSETQIELAGTTAGAQFDVLDISGAATLGGTLEVSLINGFAPSVGNSLEILHADEGIFSEFDVTSLPTLSAGLDWDVVYSEFSVILEVASAALPGDFDLDGDVDGRDFLIWQRGGSPNPLSAGDLADWQAGYGTSSLATSQAVPEPTTGLAATTLIGLLMKLGRFRRSTYRRGSMRTTH